MIVAVRIRVDISRNHQFHRTTPAIIIKKLARNKSSRILVLGVKAGFSDIPDDI
jgi:hypothetical protein